MDRDGLVTTEQKLADCGGDPWTTWTPRVAGGRLVGAAALWDLNSLRLLRVVHREDVTDALQPRAHLVEGDDLDGRLRRTEQLKALLRILG